MALIVALLLAGVTAASVVAAGTPTATTGAPSSVTSASATVSGTVNPNGTPTAYAFQYGTTTGYGEQTSSQSAGSGTSPVPVSASLTGLPSGTTIHYRIVATFGTKNSSTVVGADSTFTTRGAPAAVPAPTATTAPATAVTSHTAQLNGTVGPAGSGSSYYFQYGLTANYGVQTSPAALTQNLTGQPVKSALSGLQSGVTYHYRLVTRSSSGLTSVGQDATFATPAATPKHPRALSLSARSTVASRSVKVTVSGKLQLPSGVTAAQGCSGVVSVQIKAGTLTLSNRSVVLSRTCTYHERVTITTARLHGHKRLNVRARFHGNAVLLSVFSRRATVRA